MQLTLVYLAKDLLSLFQKSVFNPGQYIMFREYIQGSNVDFQKAFELIQNSHFSLVMDLSRYQVGNLIDKENLVSLFEKGTHYLTPTQEAMSKLKEQHVRIVEYLELVI